MKIAAILETYQSTPTFRKLREALLREAARVHLDGLRGSAAPVIAAALFREAGGNHILILPDAESAAYVHNDLENLLEEKDEKYFRKTCLFFPPSFKRHYEKETVDANNVLSRTEVLKRLSSRSRSSIIVTYPDALHEKVVSKNFLQSSSMRFRVDEEHDIDQLYEQLTRQGFHHVDFVIEPGQFSIRGGILDVFSYSNDLPYRLEFFGDSIESIRSFDPGTQLSSSKLQHISVVPDLQSRQSGERRDNILHFVSPETVIWIQDLEAMREVLQRELEKAVNVWEGLPAPNHEPLPAEIFVDPARFLSDLQGFRLLEFGHRPYLDAGEVIRFSMDPQPSFNKNFELLYNTLLGNQAAGVINLFLTENPKQYERMRAIMDDIHSGEREVVIEPVMSTLHEGFTDKDQGLAFYTDHQIFERYHKYRLRDRFARKDEFTLKEIYQLQPGDFVTHIDHGVGRFDGLEKIDNNGKLQEAIRLIYQNGDILYVSIHALHRISKYVGKEGTPPRIDKLGSNAWNKVKTKAKKKVKDIARDLIKLYAQRKAAGGFAFSPDTYLQHELEASFIYEDTPDQLKATLDVKGDMEAEHPMDRLICGDVGFGKTEIAIRAAFKAVTDSKQVGVLVPTTILALQHFKTFTERLSEFPCRVEYINRFRSAVTMKRILKETAEGKVDILIGTHRLLSKDVVFRNLGLLIVDEEQKFGVSAKEKLKQMKVNVDTLTLTATPIPRTLQFSLLGARDLSVINTPPSNRYPIQTELHTFNEDIIRQAIDYELSRGGQVFFLNNRVQNITEVADIVQRCAPHARIAIGHGQMEGSKLEQVMLDFIEGEYDILVATTIIESGLDIPNANTIIINEAHHYGLSDLHQLRGRVGRSNKKAFCYLLAPPTTVLTAEARRRLKAIEEFSTLGSGFNIAMRDLDIRGAGNLLGAEQSGFITDIGYEMYQKIIHEAVMELKEEEFRDLFDKEDGEEYSHECVLETDLALHIPDHYVSNIAERLSLYKELDELSTDEDLIGFATRLEDRFGEVPGETMELIRSITLRRTAQALGFERLVLRSGRMTGYFVSNPDSPFYSSKLFQTILEYVKRHPSGVRMKEVKEKLTLSFPGVGDVDRAIRTLEGILGSGQD